ncbi:MAG: 4-hydroxy-3-methylbut-2-enyl diphosphate reductase, partial [Lachnospiraceae bacterium]|nr:4-hydroxy-3-methylbut-2-enyl diphosphate reductase [Lachnospiraceae bacterium]
MKVKVAKTAGFCFGVKRAVELAEQQAASGKKVYTYGPIIHNEEVTASLEKKGVKIVSSKEEWNRVPPGTIIIRSHGVSKAEFEEMQDSGHEILDATCPFVKKIHRIVAEQSNSGRHIIVIGSEEHPEVQGIIGWCNGPVSVVETPEMVQKLEIKPGEKVCVVAQTTFNSKKFQDLVEIIEKKRYDIIVLSTICSATEERQKETSLLAQESEAMVVIGGLHSSNTRKLYEISKQKCVNTYFIQKLSDLDLNLFKSFRSVGITAGASTPNNIIE